MGTHVPLLDLKAQYQTIRNEIRLAIDEVLESQGFILGPKVENFESEVAAYSGTKHAIGVSSGTDALLVALMAIGIKPGDEIITTPFTFFATAGVIARLGAVPVFVDIERTTFNMDAKQLSRAITKKTRAIIPVHLFGQSADMDPILAVAREHGIPAIEDAAQSIGAEYKRKRAGSMGTAGTFSFFPSKNLGGFGDGGMVVTDDASLAERIRALRNHGAVKPYEHHLVGGNFRLDALQAAVLSVKLKYLDIWSAARRENAKYYDQHFRESGLIDGGFIEVPLAAYLNSGDKNYHIYNQYILRARGRNDLRAYLREAGIESAVYYPIPLHLQYCFKGLDYSEGSFPTSEQAANEVISIPVYPELTDRQKDHVVEAIISYYRAGDNR